MAELILLQLRWFLAIAIVSLMPFASLWLMMIGVRLAADAGNRVGHYFMENPVLLVVILSVMALTSIGQGLIVRRHRNRQIT